jgi:ABC-type nitrate/sulfonate/bicarbonate transport system substrate-binding protein
VKRFFNFRISTCGRFRRFLALYTALDNGLFDKYGMKSENIFIRGSDPNLMALAGDDV